MRLARRRTPPRDGGFTMIEVLITLTILAFGLLALGAVQIQAMKQQSAGRHTGDGASIARSYLEQAARLPWATLTGAAGGGWVAPGWTGIPAAQVTVDRPNGLADTTERSYTIRWRVTDIGAAPICLRDVEVRATWEEDGFPAPRSHEVGTRRYNTGDPNC